jgi:hypothetical protein
MYRLSDELPFVNLAVSLHAPNQQVRTDIVPAARAHPIEKLMAAVDYHIVKNIQYVESSRVTAATVVSKRSKPVLISPVIDTSTEITTTAEPTATTTSITTTNSGSDAVRCKSPPVILKRNSNKKVGGVMIEYILIRDVNDKNEHAHELAALLTPRKDHVFLNLIPYNPTKVANDYLPPLWEQVDIFHDICRSEPYNIHCRVRREKGQDIAGACGQLALVRMNPKSAAERTADLEDLLLTQEQEGRRYVLSFIFRAVIIFRTN